MNCCNIEAVVSFDERGQLVLPKDLRKKFNLQAGDKFGLVSCANGEKLCCLALVRVEEMQSSIKDILAPVFSDDSK